MLWQARPGFIGARGALDASTAASTPLTILSGAGYIGWWDSQDVATITQSSGLVSQWNDKGSGGDNLTASGSARPTIAGSGSTTTITFDETANVLKTADDGISIGTTDKLAFWFVGQRLTGIDISARLASYVGVGGTEDYNNTGSAVLLWERTTGEIGSYRQGYKAQKTVSADTTVRLLALFDGTNNDVFLNNTGATPVASTGNFGATGTLYVGAGTTSPPTPANFAKIIVKELVLCAGLTITSGMRSDMETYFTGRW